MNQLIINKKRNIVNCYFIQVSCWESWELRFSNNKFKKLRCHSLKTSDSDFLSNEIENRLRQAQPSIVNLN
jgi:hypothetical protein